MVKARFHVQVRLFDKDFIKQHIDVTQHHDCCTLCKIQFFFKFNLMLCNCLVIVLLVLSLNPYQYHYL